MQSLVFLKIPHPELPLLFAAGLFEKKLTLIMHSYSYAYGGNDIIALQYVSIRFYDMPHNGID